MLKEKLSALFGLIMALIALFLFPIACIAKHETGKDCGSSHCGNVTVNLPFRLKSQPPECGYSSLEMDCDGNNRTTFEFVNNYGKNIKVYVQEISYENQTMRVMFKDLEILSRHHCSLPPEFLYEFRRSFEFYFDLNSTSRFHLSYMYPSVSIMFLVNCTRLINSSLYIDASRCPNSPSSSYFYFLDEETRPGDFDVSCTVIASTPIMLQNITGQSTLDIYRKILLGYEFEWSSDHRYFRSCPNWFYSTVECQVSLLLIWEGLLYGLRIYADSFVRFLFHDCSYNKYVAPKRTYILCVTITGIVLLRTLLGISPLIAFMTYKLRRRHLSADDTIEEFLQSQNNFVPIRYSYYEIKRITSGFKEKLGEGGFGSVFKGKLRSNHLVAIKLLDKSKANGQDFINEVSTMGRIYHVNVAKLVGFCVEGSKQALVYDFMPNGSLDRIIFAEESKIQLGWQKMFDIVLGVARGINYLHQGCDMQILHFDIKPHNILLDENFIPKISDFGLAKLYSVEDSIVSLTAARGTFGYIAPELVYKNIGGISYKADVYSFGMLLLEIVGRRKNLNAFAEQSSQIYFPSWSYDRLDEGKEIEFGDATDSEKILVRKMLVAAYWCIQMKPTDRPSMSKVLEMLEADTKCLEMPPRPFHCLLETSSEDDVTNNLVEEPTTSSVWM